MRCRSGSFPTADGDLGPPLPQQQQFLGGAARTGHRLGSRSFTGLAVERRADPAGTPLAGLLAVEAAVDEDPGEPDLERQVLAERLDVREHLHEGVLHGLVRIRRVPQEVVGDPRGPALLPRHQRRRTGPAPPRRFPSRTSALISAASRESSSGRGRSGSDTGSVSTGTVSGARLPGAFTIRGSLPSESLPDIALRPGPGIVYRLRSFHAPRRWSHCTGKPRF